MKLTQGPSAGWITRPPLPVITHSALALSGYSMITRGWGSGAAYPTPWYWLRRIIGDNVVCKIAGVNWTQSESNVHCTRRDHDRLVATHWTHWTSVSQVHYIIHRLWSTICFSITSKVWSLSEMRGLRAPQTGMLSLVEMLLDWCSLIGQIIWHDCFEQPNKTTSDFNKSKLINVLLQTIL